MASVQNYTAGLRFYSQTINWECHRGAHTGELTYNVISFAVVDKGTPAAPDWWISSMVIPSAPSDTLLFQEQDLP